MSFRKTVCIVSLLVAMGLPPSATALSVEAARHLLSRTTFGAIPADIQELMELPQTQAVSLLIERTRTEPLTESPEWVDEPLPERASLRAMDEDERAEMRKRWRERGMELKTWWYTEMVATDSPLTEKMTLFWHNHFTSSLRKVKSPQLLYRQNQLLRQHALGNFAELLHAIARDPAMLVYLDNHTNRAGNPNENFARELLELFTLGEGYYTEADIKEAARAFTGWGVDRNDGKHRMWWHRHDDGDKTILGITGDFDGHDVIEILLEHPRTAAHITEKLWREFVDNQPPPAAIESIARQFRASGYDIAVTLHAVLTSPEFNDPDNRGTQIKSPVELLVGTVRTLELPVRKGRLLTRAGRGLGQDLFDPPNVKGWPGGEQWITSDTLMNRQHMLERVVESMDAGSDTDMNGGVLEHWVESVDETLRTPEGVRSILLALTTETASYPDKDLVMVVREALLDPVYQLK